MSVLAPVLAMHTWTLDRCSLPEALDAIQRAGWEGVELRQADFDRCQREGMSHSEVLELVAAGGLKVVTLGTRYGWLFGEEVHHEAFAQSLEHSCRIAQALGCPVLMTAAGHGHESMEVAARNLRSAGQIARDHGLRVAVEFNFQHGVLNSLERLTELLARADHPSCGALIDAYHLYRSGRTDGSLAGLDSEQLFAFQFSDCPAASPDGSVRATDRLLPGQGVVDWTALVKELLSAGYSGPWCCEAPNPEFWRQDAPSLAARALEAAATITAMYVSSSTP